VTAVDVRVVNGLPLVRLRGQVTERSGRDLAAAVMSAIHFMTESPDEHPRPLSLEAPRNGTRS
jgi:hypothetical protein